AAPLALGSRERELLACLGMQKDRKIAAHRPEAEGTHLLRRGSADDESAIRDRPAEQFVAHRAAHPVDLHPRAGPRQTVVTPAPRQRAESSTADLCAQAGISAAHCRW